MKVAVVQHDIVWEEKDANFARLAPMIGRGTCNARIASKSGSDSTAATAAASRSGGASPRTSMGFSRATSGGNSASSALIVDAPRCASATPATAAQSAASAGRPLRRWAAAATSASDADPIRHSGAATSDQARSARASASST